MFRSSKRIKRSRARIDSSPVSSRTTKAPSKPSWRNSELTPSVCLPFVSHSFSPAHPFGTTTQQSTQQYHLDLIRHYENILLSFPSQPIGQNQPLPSAAEPAEPSIDPLHLSLSLSHLASLIRKALRSLQGEDPEDGSSPLLFPTPTDNDDLASLASQLSSLNFPHSAYSSASASGSTRSYSTNSSTLDSPPLPPSTPRHTRDESEGGYIGKSATTSPHHLPTTSSSSLVPSPPKPGETLLPDLLPRKIVRDDALEAEIELEALRTENEELRRMLGISKSQEEVGGAESYGAAVDDIN